MNEIRRRIIKNSKSRDYSNEYLTFEALEDGTFLFTKSGLSYSTNNGKTWTALNANTATPTVNAGNKIMFKGEMTPSTTSGIQGIGKFSATGRFNASGNIMSLLYGDDFIDQTDLTGKDYAFCELFKQNDMLIDVTNLILPATTLAIRCYNRMFNICTSLTTAPELRATTLAQNCCTQMFDGCTNLTTPPKLPATSLAAQCYQSMFQSCTSLATAPELPATTMASSCYSSMLSGCTSLTTAPTLPATTLANNCYQNMFSNCTSLTTAPELLPATTLADYCYSGMFQSCTSLTTAPELPATMLAQKCYTTMFYGCNNLNYIKAMFTTTPSKTYTANWVNGVSSTGTFVKNSAASWNETGANGIPEGWTVETAGGYTK